MLIIAFFFHLEDTESCQCKTITILFLIQFLLFSIYQIMHFVEETIKQKCMKVDKEWDAETLEYHVKKQTTKGFTIFNILNYCCILIAIVLRICSFALVNQKECSTVEPEFYKYHMIFYIGHVVSGILIASFGSVALIGTRIVAYYLMGKRQFFRI